MRPLAALALVMAVLAGCDGSEEDDPALRAATTAFCGHAADGVAVAAGMYGETELLRQRDFDAFESNARDLSSDADELEAVRAVKGEQPYLAPAARELSARATAVAELLHDGSLPLRNLFFRLQDYGDAVAGIPSGACAHTRLTGAGTRRMTRDLAVEVRCVHIGRITRILVRLLSKKGAKSGKDLDETAEGLAIAGRLFAFAGDARKAKGSAKLAGIVEEWARRTRSGGDVHALFDRAGRLVRSFGRCPEF